MFVSTTISVDLKGLEKFKASIESQLNGQSSGPIHDALKLWAVRYRSWVQQRFDIFSKGGGDWQKLAASTIKKRRKGAVANVLKLRQVLEAKVKRDPQAVTGGGQVSILRDTGLLFNALAPIFAGAPGAIEELIKFGIRCGYGGPQRHALIKSRSPATIADIANFHQVGNLPKLPKREIIVPPPATLITTMADDMQKALEKVARGQL